MTYLPRIALPPAAVVRVRLEDVSRADAPSVTLAEQVIRTGGRQVPIPFELSYDRARIDDRARYVIRADIRDAEGALLWITDTAHPVRPLDPPARAFEVRVVQVRGGSEPPSGRSAGPWQEPGQTFVFECAATVGTFSFTTRTGARELAVWLPSRFDNRYVVLGQVRAASGARYRDGDVTVWNKDEEALLEVAGQTYDGCALDRVASVWESARLDGVSFRAVGQEPGWYLEIRPDRHIRFVHDYGAREVFTPVPAAKLDPALGRTTYHAETEAHDLTILIDSAGSPCRDTMSGDTYEATVTVVLDGTTYRGCGRSLRAPVPDGRLQR